MVAILSRKRSLYSTRRLVEAIRARGHRPLVLDTLRCNLVLTSGAPRMVFRGVELRGLDVVIPRIGASITGYGLAVVEQLEMMGVPARQLGAGHRPEPGQAALPAAARPVGAATSPGR